jgi:mRNA-degrading endonuclease RelE of RelBE toxin-antitoxin system
MDKYIAKFSNLFEKKLSKLQKTDVVLYEQILSKIEDILSNSNINRYKNLKCSLINYKRVHVSSFVLLFRLEASQNCIYFDDVDHHDTIYRT